MEHYKLKFKGGKYTTSPEENITEFCRKYGITLPKLSLQTSAKLNFDLTLPDIKYAIDLLNSQSAPGPDLLQTKLIKHLFKLIPRNLARFLSHEFSRVLKGDTKCPKMWKRKVILIKKK